MANYNAARTVIDASREELIEIFRWVQARGEDERDPLTVLIGGWAVYCYNPWYGSVDIDLITNSRARHHLMKYLRDERRFTHRRHPLIPNTVAKHSPEGEILIDFGSREDICRFEGRTEECPFSARWSYRSSGDSSRFTGCDTRTHAAPDLQAESGMGPFIPAPKRHLK